NKTKQIASKVGSSSLDVLKDISAQVISNLISSQFGK
ncbi:PF10711 family protein, partial [Streptococcus canis]